MPIVKTWREGGKKNKIIIKKTIQLSDGRESSRHLIFPHRSGAGSQPALLSASCTAAGLPAAEGAAGKGGARLGKGGGNRPGKGKGDRPGKGKAVVVGRRRLPPRRALCRQGLVLLAGSRNKKIRRKKKKKQNPNPTPPKIPTPTNQH